MSDDSKRTPAFSLHLLSLVVYNRLSDVGCRLNFFLALLVSWQLFVFLALYLISVPFQRHVIQSHEWLEIHPGILLVRSFDLTRFMYKVHPSYFLLHSRGQACTRIDYHWRTIAGLEALCTGRRHRINGWRRKTLILKSREWNGVSSQDSGWGTLTLTTNAKSSWQYSRCSLVSKFPKRENKVSSDCPRYQRRLAGSFPRDFGVRGKR